MEFGGSLSQYVGSIAEYQTYQTEEKPFPFGKRPAPKKPVISSSDAEVTEEAKAPA